MYVYRTRIASGARHESDVGTAATSVCVWRRVCAHPAFRVMVIRPACLLVCWWVAMQACSSISHARLHWVHASRVARASPTLFSFSWWSSIRISPSSNRESTNCCMRCISFISTRTTIFSQRSMLTPAGASAHNTRWTSVRGQPRVCMRLSDPPSTLTCGGAEQELVRRTLRVLLQHAARPLHVRSA